MKLLHIAPEKNLQKILKRKKIEYFSGDLNRYFVNASLKVDVTDIKFQDNFFDMVICNHVLEHVLEDKKAMKEIYRVLKPGGKAILQVPYSPIMKKTFEDSSITTEEGRKEVFGQPDHVRIYGLDYLDRLKSAGFKVEKKKLDETITKKFALNKNEVIFLCKKSRK